jgi:hypothetical protein
MLRDPVRDDKFEPVYVGPYSVVRRAHNGGYVLRDATGDILDRHVPVDQLKLISKMPRAIDENNNIYIVKRILQHRGEPGNYEYLVDWKGYKEKTWEPEEHFQDYDVIKHYWDAYQDTDAATSTNPLAMNTNNANKRRKRKAKH